MSETKTKKKHRGLRLQKYVSDAGNICSENRIMRLMIFLMFIGMIYLGYQIEVNTKQQKTVIIPPFEAKGFSIGLSTADVGYYNRIGMMIADLYLDVSAANARGKYAELLKLFSTDSHNKYRDKLKKRITDMESYKNISYMAGKRMDKPVVVENDSLMKIPVLIKKVIGNKTNPATEISLAVDFRMDNGRFEITDLKETKP